MFLTCSDLQELSICFICTQRDLYTWVRDTWNFCFFPRQFTIHLLQGQSSWSSPGLNALLKGTMAVVNGLSLLGLKLTIFWLTAQMLNHISAQHPLWGRHVLDIIIEL